MKDKTYLLEFSSEQLDVLIASIENSINDSLFKKNHESIAKILLDSLKYDIEEVE